MFLSVWFISLSIYVLKAYLGCPMYQNFIPVYSWMIPHYNIYIYMPQFGYTLVHGHLGCFSLVAVVSNTAVSMDVQVSELLFFWVYA